jgi:hypothetical protein
MSPSLHGPLSGLGVPDGFCFGLGLSLGPVKQLSYDLFLCRTRESRIVTPSLARRLACSSLARSAIRPSHPARRSSTSASIALASAASMTSAVSLVGAEGCPRLTL